MRSTRFCIFLTLLVLMAIPGCGDRSATTHNGDQAGDPTITAPSEYEVDTLILWFRDGQIDSTAVDDVTRIIEGEDIKDYDEIGMTFLGHDLRADYDIFDSDAVAALWDRTEEVQKSEQVTWGWIKGTYRGGKAQH